MQRAASILVSFLLFEKCVCETTARLPLVFFSHPVAFESMIICGLTSLSLMISPLTTPVTLKNGTGWNFFLYCTIVLPKRQNE